MSYIQLFKTGHNEYQTESTAEMKWKLKMKKQTNHFLVFDESEEYGMWCYATYGGTRDSEWVHHRPRKNRYKKVCSLQYMLHAVLARGLAAHAQDHSPLQSW